VTTIWSNFIKRHWDVKVTMHYKTSAVVISEDTQTAPEAEREATRIQPNNIVICENLPNTIRWQEGERLDHLYEQMCTQLEAERKPDQLAIITENGVVTFRELDNRANRVARYLIYQGVKSGDKVGLMFDKSVDTYVALLAVLKANAAYVPFDGSFPNDRIGFIIDDASVKAIVSQSVFKEKLSAFDVPAVFLDTASDEIDAFDASRLTEDERGASADEIAYIIYTSGTTGKPKGVVIEHASICNFVRVAAEIYGYGPKDRVYQGMTIAFDFSVEEIWVPLLAGSALVPGKAGTNLAGADLGDYLEEHKVTALACVPTLLATIERDLPDLRLLIVSGEACSQNLVTRWHKLGRTILNAYGPTETTVTCTLTELVPDKPVTIGRPLPTYTIVILDPDKDELLGAGEMGEISIAGIGLAQGYLKRPDLTAEKFILDFIGLPNNPSKRIYRSGDLGCINEDDEVEFHGRIDTQVKVRGYRIELTEIESVLMAFSEIAQVVVDTYEPEPGTVELAAYYALNEGYHELSHTKVGEVLKARLPRYMIPAYLEELPIIPMTPNQKADRKALPAPKGPRFAPGSGKIVVPRNEKEEFLVKALSDILQVEEISIEDNFFLDLGAHSLLMARFCSAIRQDPNFSAASMRDIYLHPTVAGLAEHLRSAGGISSVEIIRQPLHIPSDLAYYGCGAAQLVFFAILGLIGLLIVAAGSQWAYAAIDDWPTLYGRLLLFAAAVFAGGSLFAIAVKWLVIGKWKEASFPVWGIQYFRFWAVKSILQSSPMRLFIGTPIYNLYLRLLGAKVGRHCVIMSSAPVCTDLFSIGDDGVIREHTILQGYKAESNVIQTGSIHIGKNAYIGAASVVDINTVIADDTQLGHSSALLSGQEIPNGKHFHGTPAEETEADYCTVPPMECSTARRFIYSLALTVLGFAAAPIAAMILFYLFSYVYAFTGAADISLDSPVWVFIAFMEEMAFTTFVLFFVFFTLGLGAVYCVPRVFNSFLEKDKPYPVFGLHYFLQSIVSASSNSAIYNLLFGDSSYIVGYLRYIGCKLNQVTQTGANFGLDQVHHNPFLCDVGSGSMVSDGLVMMNTDVSSCAFRLGKVKIGGKNYLGNNIHFPARAKTGENCLLATKVMIPIDGPVRENTGLLGSPCFEIPRLVERDRALARLTEEAISAGIAKKNKVNLVTIAAYVLAYWLLGYMSIHYYQIYGTASLVVFGVLGLLFSIFYFVAMERASLKFGSLAPHEVTMYDEYFWFHERHWKFCGNPLPYLFKGTPFKNLISRLLGVKLGKKVFDDGGKFYDKTLIEIGDYANFNESCSVQGHSLEEGVFKCERIKIGSGVTLAAGAFVHYGVTMGDNSLLGPNAFLMKGENVPANSLWQGNPAREV
jgi:non-ribosomal peptide synthetase-like protein